MGHAVPASPTTPRPPTAASSLPLPCPFPLKAQHQAFLSWPLRPL